MKPNHYFLKAIVFVTLIITNNALVYSQSARRTRADTIIERAMAYDNGGHIVEIADAQECINLFESDMLKHQIMDLHKRYPKGAKSTTVASPRMITTAEVFGGKRLHEWMDTTINTLDPIGLGDNVGFKLAFGIYTDTFLNKYLKGPENEHGKENRKDRITIFIIPFRKRPVSSKNGNENSKSGNTLQKAASTVTNSIPQGATSAYELGGLQP